MSTGVIVGIDANTTAEQADMILHFLADRFPGVVFALVSGASSVTFSFEPPAKWHVAGDA